jgi:hypothetical protein
MPVMDGRAFVQEAEKRYPGIKARTVMHTGNPNDARGLGVDVVDKLQFDGLARWFSTLAERDRWPAAAQNNGARPALLLFPLDLQGLYEHLGSPGWAWSPLLAIGLLMLTPFFPMESARRVGKRARARTALEEFVVSSAFNVFTEEEQSSFVDAWDNGDLDAARSLSEIAKAREAAFTGSAVKTMPSVILPVAGKDVPLPEAALKAPAVPSTMSPRLAAWARGFEAVLYHGFFMGLAPFLASYGLDKAAGIVLTPGLLAVPSMAASWLLFQRHHQNPVFWEDGELLAREGATRRERAVLGLLSAASMLIYGFLVFGLGMNPAYAVLATGTLWGFYDGVLAERLGLPLMMAGAKPAADVDAAARAVLSARGESDPARAILSSLNGRALTLGVADMTTVARRAVESAGAGAPQASLETSLGRAGARGIKTSVLFVDALEAVKDWDSLRKTLADFSRDGKSAWVVTPDTRVESRLAGAGVPTLRVDESLFAVPGDDGFREVNLSRLKAVSGTAAGLFRGEFALFRSSAVQLTVDKEEPDEALRRAAALAQILTILQSVLPAAAVDLDGIRRALAALAAVLKAA